MKNYVEAFETSWQIENLNEVVYQSKKKRKKKNSYMTNYVDSYNIGWQIENFNDVVRQSIQ